ncbi:MAG TPA: MgtC/SapB family protein [Candidatus Limnocylindria bacterium]|nr:MgtC/SapB family protein [Candidatus Limnocylindria bacterium]
MPADVAHELDVAARLLVAALLGAAIGLEREIHDHPAGMRTHLLVALGSALFTVISIFGFVGVLGAGQSTPVDPSRVAAQVVTGIGFLGAGAILKFGTTVRGLTTAASLWTAAAIGMAAGAADYVLAVVGTAIVVFSLWPLNWVEDRIHGPAAEIANMRLELRRLDAIGRISDAARTHRLDLVSIDTQRLAKGRYEVALQLRVRSATSLESFVLALGSLADVDILESGRRE